MIVHGCYKCSQKHLFIRGSNNTIPGSLDFLFYLLLKQFRDLTLICIALLLITFIINNVLLTFRFQYTHSSDCKVLCTLRSVLTSEICPVTFTVIFVMYNRAKTISKLTFYINKCVQSNSKESTSLRRPWTTKY